MKKLILILVVLLGTVKLFAQYEVEALSFSQRFLQSDARSAGIGNAYGAVGANFISSSINPAGIAVFRSSEFTLSNSFFYSSTESSYLGTNVNGHKFNYNIPSLGLVLTHVNEIAGKAVTEGWVSYTFAGGVNRTNNFHKRLNMTGVNKENSILDYFVESANGISKENLPFVTGLVYDSWLIDNPDNNNPTAYVNAFTDSLPNFRQTKSEITRGSAYDMNFTFGGNYSNIVYLGGTVSFPSIHYHSISEFTETNLNDNPKNYHSSTFKSEVDVNSEIGFKTSIGILIKPFNFIRFGGSIETPTFYKLSESYEESVLPNLMLHDSNIIQSGIFSYNFLSPFRSTLSMALFLGKFGFISVDYEMLDYSLAYYSSDDYSFMDENNAIETHYGNVHNIRVGAELRYNIFTFRGGYNLYESPYKEIFKPDNADGSTEIYSAGIGVREKNIFFDLTYQMIKRNDYYLPYSLKKETVEGAIEKNKINNIILTMGLKF
ncbi:MAG: hypothetical protein U9R42_10615 [Bacteroidota bacterium]|nr:hypothetical protein [Bacteroidota bacterium]